jgi:small-conductance mechanosensitive channel
VVPRTGRPTALVVATLLLAGSPAARAGSGQPAGSPDQEPPPESQPGSAETEVTDSAPVMLGGEPVVWIFVGVGPYTAGVRAENIARRTEQIVHDKTIRDPTVSVVESADSSELRVENHLLMVVTARDARAAGVNRSLLAQQAARTFEAAIRAERLRYAPATLVRSGIYGAIATIALGVAVWLTILLTRWMHGRVDRWRSRWLAALRVQGAELVSAQKVTQVISYTTSLLRFALLLLLVDLYLTFVLGLFPWTRAVSLQLLEYLVTPIRFVALSFVGYLPNLLFVIVIGAFVHLLNRLLAAFFMQVQHGHITFRNFPAEWAEPTGKIMRVLLIAFGLVVAFPYLPASSSPAFAGVSVFMGVLISLASSSALANVISGLVLMYTGAFRLGDRVKVGDSFGDIVDTSLLATRLRTIKNEEITIPNAIVLGSAVTNYSREAKTRGLILHTSVTIGYDTPWRTVHGLLLDAAAATPRVVAEPAPFVWQTALNDFYVTYELNAYTNDAQEMVATYAALHAHIQDAFFDAGVEIMSPHYTSLRDGNTVTIPEASRPPGYVPSGFRIGSAVPVAEAAGRVLAHAPSSHSR